MTDAMIRPAPIRKRFEVRAGPARAFDIFTGSMGAWWPKEHSVLMAMQQIAQKDVRIESHVGGRWYEVGETGAEYPWGEVRAWEPPSRLVLTWRLSQNFEYDPTLDTEVEVRFSPGPGGGTVVELEHRGLEAFGPDGAAMIESLTGGWEFITGLFAEQAA